MNRVFSSIRNRSNNRKKKLQKKREKTNILGEGM